MWMFFAWCSLLVGVAVALLNIVLEVVEPLLYRRRYGSLEGYRHPSMVPFVSWICALNAVLASDNHIGFVVAFWVLLVVDPGTPLGVAFWWWATAWRKRCVTLASPGSPSKEGEQERGGDGSGGGRNRERKGH